MAWQPYIDNLLASNMLDKAAIVGTDGSVWACSPQFNVTQDEAKAILSGLQRKETVQGCGVRLCGQKFFYLQSDEGQMQCKHGNCGCSIARGKTFVIIGTYGEGKQPGAARDVVEKMAAYLKENGY